MRSTKIVATLGPASSDPRVQRTVVTPPLQPAEAETSDLVNGSTSVTTIPLAGFGPAFRTSSLYVRS